RRCCQRSARRRSAPPARPRSFAHSGNPASRASDGPSRSRPLPAAVARGTALPAAPRRHVSLEPPRDAHRPARASANEDHRRQRAGLPPAPSLRRRAAATRHALQERPPGAHGRLPGGHCPGQPTERARRVAAAHLHGRQTRPRLPHTAVRPRPAPPLLGLMRIYRRRLRGQARAVKALDSSAQSVVQEVLAGIRVVKAFGQELREQERFVSHSRAGMRARLRLAFVENGFGLLVGLTTAGGTAAVVSIGAHHVLSGRLTLGELLMVMAYLSQLYEPLKTISKKSASLQSHLAGA